MNSQFAAETSESGEFQRQEDAFREWVSNDRSTPYPAVDGRYHLYVSLACPWASRTVIFRKLKGLEEAIGMTIVDPVRDEKGWAFRDPEQTRPGSSRNLDEFESTDPINGFHYLSEAYKATDPDFNQRVTVPVLWDKKTRKIVNNCEDDICRMFNDAFNAVPRNKGVDLFPADIEAEHSKLCDFLYKNINNGVYKAGFATRQRPYEISARKLFDALDLLEERLASSRYLFGQRTGGFSVPSLGLTWFTMATSNAISDALLITQTWKATCWIYINDPESQTRLISIISSATTI
jgi:putative glutathione S-transferase